MKATLRIPTLDPYSYIEVEMEAEQDEIIGTYNSLSSAVRGGTGLSDADFRRVLDRYLWGDGHMLAEEYEGMNLDQQSIIQTIKRSRARNKK